MSISTTARALTTTAASLAALLTLALPSDSEAAATSVKLGTATSFALLAGSGVTNSGPSVVNGDLGTAPTPAVTGFDGAPSDAAGQGPPDTLATELGGQTLTPGVYDSSSGTFGITGAVTLDAQGDPDAVFVFKTNTTLISASASTVNLINGAQSCHVFWKVGSSATLGSASDFTGNILALQSISLDNAVTVDGRLLARNGAVTLINDTITRAQCATPPDGGGGSGGGGGTGGGGGGTGGGGGHGGGGGGNGGGGGGGNGGHGGGSGGPEGPPVHISHPPRGDDHCVDHGFQAKFRIHNAARMRSISVYLDGELIARKVSKHFSVHVSVRGLRSGKNTLRVVAVDVNGRRSTSSRSFDRCAAAVPEPDFTGRVRAS
jgi:hypothetical protein